MKSLLVKQGKLWPRDPWGRCTVTKAKWRGRGSSGEVREARPLGKEASCKWPKSGQQEDGGRTQR